MARDFGGGLFWALRVCWTIAAKGRQRPDSQTQVQAGSAGQTAGPQGIELDRLVEVVNDDVILESDVDEERRLAAFQPFRDASTNTSRQQIIDRLIDRTLILQQARLQPEDEVTDQQVDEQLSALRKEIPACKQYHCETDEGWQKFVTAQGFTMEELRRVWHERMEVLRFIEVRFRSGIHIEDNEIRDYYEKTLLPQYARAECYCAEARGDFKPYPGDIVAAAGEQSAGRLVEIIACAGHGACNPAD